MDFGYRQILVYENDHLTVTREIWDDAIGHHDQIALGDYSEIVSIPLKDAEAFAKAILEAIKMEVP